MQPLYYEIWTQDGCSYCDKAKNLMTRYGLKFREMNLSAEYANAKDDFKRKFSTVPQIYAVDVLKKEFIGGYDDLVTHLVEIPLTIECQRLSPTAIIPTRGSAEAIGADLYANLGMGESMIIPPNEVKIIPTGIAMKAPPGHYLRVAPRSGLSVKGLDTMAGVIDRDYRGEIKVIVVNHNYENLEINHGSRVAQVIAEKATIVPIVEVDDLGSTARGAAGLGSTGR